jgi:hypothetical protein
VLGKSPIILVFLVLFPFTGYAEEEGTAGRTGDSYYTELASRLEDAGKEVAGKLLQDEGVLTTEDLELLSSLDEEIRRSLYGDLIDRSSLLLLLAREQVRAQQRSRQQDERAEQIVLASLRDRRNQQASRLRAKLLKTSLATSLTSFTLAFTFWGLGERQDQLYFEAETVDEAVRHRTCFKAFAIISLISAAVGVVSSGVTVAVLAGWGPE